MRPPWPIDIFKQDDVERRIGTLTLRCDLASVSIDRRSVERDYQIEFINNLCREISLGRPKMLVEMATDAGKTRTAAAFIKRLFEADAITRVLFLVDRIPLAKQTEDAPLPSTCRTTRPMYCAPVGVSRTRSASPSARCRAW